MDFSSELLIDESQYPEPANGCLRRCPTISLKEFFSRLSITLFNQHHILALSCLLRLCRRILSSSRGNKSSIGCYSECWPSWWLLLARSTRLPVLYLTFSWEAPKTNRPLCSAITAPWAPSHFVSQKRADTRSIFLTFSILAIYTRITVGWHSATISS